MAERKVRKTAGKTAANTTKRTATKTTAKTAAKRTTRTKAAAKEDFRIGELDQYLFSMGTHYDIYKKMGAHEAVMNGKKGVYFAVWAPNAATVSVIGEFNGWREEANPMTRLEPSGIYEGFVVGAKVGMLYKFFIDTGRLKACHRICLFSPAVKFTDHADSSCIQDHRYHETQME